MMIEKTPIQAQSPVRNPPELSIVVVAYEMAREIPRTLRSLSPAYQRSMGQTGWEVLLVDNGSSQPQTAAEFAHLGLELTCLRTEGSESSPVAAINLGLDRARGRWIGVWIDGARIASPGLLAAACDALRLSPRAVVAARGRYLGPDVQSESMRCGYDRAEEDRLLAEACWEEDGYRLFGHSVFDESTGPTWFSPLSESNSLFLSRDMWRELGGYERRFTSPGGGLANLDTWTRALELPGSVPIVLLGEATFHQFHGGRMTNAHDKPARWRELCAEYEAIRGCPWRWPQHPVQYWGRFTHPPAPSELVVSRKHRWALRGRWRRFWSRTFR
jgi:glycosyltransferase involved in cell wall biosynthesis